MPTFGTWVQPCGLTIPKHLTYFPTWRFVPSPPAYGILLSIKLSEPRFQRFATARPKSCSNPAARSCEPMTTLSDTATRNPLPCLAVKANVATSVVTREVAPQQFHNTCHEPFFATMRTHNRLNIQTSCAAAWEALPSLRCAQGRASPPKQ